MYQLIIAEKPSVAQSIAAVLGAKRRETRLSGGRRLPRIVVLRASRGVSQR